MKNPTEETQIALVQKDISNIQKDVNEIKITLKELSSSFVTKETFSEHIKENDDNFKNIEEKHELWKWLSPSLAAVLGSIMTFLIIQYLTRLNQ